MIRSALVVPLIACFSLCLGACGGGGSSTGASSTGMGGTGGSSAGAGGSGTGGSASGTGGAQGGMGGSAAGNGGTGGNGGSGGSQSSDLGRCAMFPPDNPWNTDISGYPVHSNSDDFIDSIGRGTNLHPDFGTEWQGSIIGIPYTTVDSSQPGVPVTFDYADESDEGPYPIPPDVTVEGGSDRHVLVVETDNCVLYELFNATTDDDGASWHAGSGAIFPLDTNALRPDRWTSADAAGLPILPGLVRYDEVTEGEIPHALRFTVSTSQGGYIAPATHAAGSGGANTPPMGLRLRMKADFDCGGLSDEVQVICTALKRYGMFVADNGSDWYVSGAHDPNWSDDNLADLRQVSGDAFEVVDTGPITAW